MLLPKHLIPVLKELTRDLVDGKYLGLERDGRAGRLDASQISWAIQNYGRHLVEPPESAFENAEAVSIKDASAPTWATDFDLWTAEEGESDLTLSVTITEAGSGRVRIEIDDLHVL
jgi:hypothetical protein